jgi:hypothetical protein
MIGERFNFEDVFFRDLTVCVLDTLEGQIKWVNRFSKGDVFVQVPIYYSLTGDERFLLDTFQDDIVSENRFVELNTDIIPRGHLTMTGFNIRGDEFANPNVWLRMVVENEKEIRKVLAKVRAVPITVNYELTIKLASEIDTFKCSQAIMDTMWLYKFMYFEHNFMNIDAVILMPDTNQITLSREKNLTSDNNIELKASFEVQTYYPAFRKDRINMEGYPRTYGDGGTYDANEWELDGFPENLVEPRPSGGPNPPYYTFPDRYPSPPGFPGSIPGPPYYTYPGFPSPIPGGATAISGTTSFTNFPNDNSNSGTNPGVNGGPPTTNQDYFLYAPKRTRWFNNILRARDAARSRTVNTQTPSANSGNSNPPIDPNA